MTRKRNQVAVLVPDPSLFPRIPPRSCVKRFKDPDAAGLLAAEHVVVLVSLAQLEFARSFIKCASERRSLRWILLGVRNEDQLELLPAFLNHVRMRSLRNALAVDQTSAIPNRIINAFCIGAETNLIADATAIDDELFVVNCAAESWKVPFDDIPPLHALTNADRADFTIADDGSHLVWPASDIHLDLQSIRFAADPEYREKVRVEALLAHRRLGEAVARIRLEAKLRQADIGGLSERQVRRIERGEGGSLSAFRMLATAHGVSVSDYLNKLAEEVSTLD